LQKDANLSWRVVRKEYNAEYRAAVDDLPKDLSSQEKKAKLLAWKHAFSYSLAKSRTTQGSEESDPAPDDD
jgi:hypothetical protein